MSYSKDQQEKNELLISNEMAGCDHQDIAEVKCLFLKSWANDEEAKEIIKAKKEEIALRATPDEMDEIMQYLRV